MEFSNKVSLREKRDVVTTFIATSFISTGIWGAVLILTIYQGGNCGSYDLGQSLKADYCRFLNENLKTLIFIGGILMGSISTIILEIRE